MPSTQFLCSVERHVLSAHVLLPSWVEITMYTYVFRKKRNLEKEQDSVRYFNRLIIALFNFAS